MAATAVPYLKNLAAKILQSNDLVAKTPTSAAVQQAATTVFANCTTSTGATGGTAPTVTTPSVPASASPATNPNPFPVAVDIEGGTITVVAVNGVTVGATDGTYIVPGNGTIAVTYSVAPTWVWSYDTNLPSTAVGFVLITIGGFLYKVPYFNV